VWGQRYRLAIEEKAAAPSVELQPQQLVLRVRPGADAAHREAIMPWPRGIGNNSGRPCRH